MLNAEPIPLINLQLYATRNTKKTYAFLDWLVLLLIHGADTSVSFVIAELKILRHADAGIL